MSRIGILTFLHNGNYGSSLQACALQRVIRSMGHDCEHMDYRPDMLEKTLNLIRSGNSPRLLIDSKKKQQVRAAQEGMRAKHRAIDGFYERRMKLSPLCRNRKELWENSGRYDILVCGSDQIWNPVWMNPAYFLDFGEPEKKRIAYAPSLGVSRMPGRRKCRIMKRKLAPFDGISVREEEGAELVAAITGKRPRVMPDPVCLMTAEEWQTIAAPAPDGKPYLLCYFIGENPAYWERAQQIAIGQGLRPLVIPVTAEGYSQERIEMLDGAGPEEFLGAVAGADMVLTDSFHGLAFGTIFGKKTELIRRYREDDPESKNSRVDHFLRESREKGIAAMRREGLAWLAEQIG